MLLRDALGVAHYLFFRKKEWLYRWNKMLKPGGKFPKNMGDTKR